MRSFIFLPETCTLRIQPRCIFESYVKTKKQKQKVPHWREVIWRRRVRLVKRRKRRQLCWFPVSIVLLYVPGPFFTCTQKKITIQNDFHGCRACGHPPRRHLETSHAPACCPATFKSPPTPGRCRRCGGRQGSRECLSQLARKSSCALSPGAAG